MKASPAAKKNGRPSGGPKPSRSNLPAKTHPAKPVGKPVKAPWRQKPPAVAATPAAASQPGSSPPTEEQESDQAQLQSSALAFYAALPAKKRRARIPFLLIDSKSLPRSGLHFLKQALSKLFGEHFSFCEWYHEYGCCKSMPCALTGFASHAQTGNSLRIRLIKSHDFDLQDPVYATNHYVRRLILLRHPLYILTSWFALQQLNNYGKELARQGIQLKKLWLQHEKEVATAAFQYLDAHFRPPTTSELEIWLGSKELYLTAFMKKWVEPLAQKPCPFTAVVRYDQLTDYLRKLVAEYGRFLEPASKSDVDVQIGRIVADFKPRDDSFSLPSAKLTEYCQAQSNLFSECAARLARLPAFK